MTKRLFDSKRRRRRAPLSPLVVVVALLVTCYITANVMSVRLLNVFGITWFDAGTIIFPITYMLGDLLTEVWGFRTARRVIWLSFLCQVLFALFTCLGVFLPAPAEMQPMNDAYATVFLFEPRIVAASLVAFLCGELINSYTMVVIKWMTHGKHLWMRTIGSSVCGYFVDTTLFVVVAFAGVVEWNTMLFMIGVQIVAKLLIESLFATPVVYMLVGRLQKRVTRRSFPTERM